MRWDLFCAVVDNLGDIGVCWRLARQLASEHGAQVRLWVDDLATFHQLAPVLDIKAARQKLGDIELWAWTPGFPVVDPADIVVETFACELPASYVAAMKTRAKAPVWINLEYLSAEPWVGGCHGLPSPQPPLVKYFFFPGFAHDTGGVLAERGLNERRAGFQADAVAQASFLAGIGIAPRKPGELIVSLFCYPQAPTSALFDAWASGPIPIRVIGFADTPSAQALIGSGVATGRRRGQLQGEIVPFLSQDDYDRVLWACDWNFVRGEDSFTRAQWAARPFVWQLYPQQEQAHRIKMQAFLARYLGASVMGSAAGLVDLWTAWNGLLPPSRVAPAWSASMATASGLSRLAQMWPEQLERLGDLAGNLARFCADRV
ncbi:MAG: elongation factor P maturation arginine rhamnosyltransferase EarP [Burkholderiales bacterium]